MRRYAQRAILAGTLLMAFPLAWAGCGSGHSSSLSGGNGGNGNSGGTTAAGGSLTGGKAGDPNGTGDEDTRPLLSAATRTAVFSAITTKMAATNNTDHDAFNQAMLAFLKTRPEFAAAGINDGCVWARFQDDTTFIIPNNRHDPPGTGKAVSRSPLTSRDAATPPTNVPDSTTLRAIEYFTDADALNFLSGQAKRYSYNFSTNGVGSATLDELRKFNNIGVAVISTHGGMAQFADGKYYYNFMSSDVRNEAAEKDTTTEIGMDVKARRIGWALASDDVAALKDKAPTRYAIGQKFVRKYWTFSPNSFLYASVCESADPDAEGFIKACFAKKLSAYAGWVHSVSPTVSNQSVEYMMDRLLGANQVDPKESPSQRAFPLEAVYNDMTVNHPELVFTPDEEAGEKAQLVIRRNSDVSAPNGFGQLAPSIAYMSVDETTEQLTISGAFGNDPGSRGTISVSGSPNGQNPTLLQMVSWAPDTILCKIPRTGDGSAGYVQVSVDGHQSNTVPLTEWRGKIRYTFGGDGTLTLGLTWNYHFRADVHTPTRYTPGEKPDTSKTVAGFYEAQDSTCTFGAGGMTSDACQGGGSISRAWIGSASLTPLTGIDPNNFPTDGKIFHLTGSIMGGHNLDLYIDSPKFTALNIHGTDCDGSEIQAITGKVSLAPETFGLHASASSYKVSLTLGSDYAIPAKTLSGVTDSTDAYGDNNPNPVSLSIQPTSVKYAPQASDGEDANRSIRRTNRRK